MEKNISEKIATTLAYDGLHEAEKVTGVSYKDDCFTSILGMYSMIQNNKLKNCLLSAAGDTTLIELSETYLYKVTSFGFEMLLDIPFKTDKIGHATDEHLYIMFHREFSILLKWDTYHDYRNSATMYYNFVRDIKSTHTLGVL